MKTHLIFMSATVAVAWASTTAAAQKPPAIRALGKIERVSTESLASAAAAVPLRDGRVYVNDIIARRVLLFDSTLASARLVADSTAATSSAYGRQPGSLFRYHGDSVLFVDPASLSMLVLGPRGTIARVMAIPRPDDAQRMLGGVFGTPGLDARGRMLYFGAPVGPSGPGFAPGRKTTTMMPDSGFIVRFDLGARILDTVVSIKVPKFKRADARDADGRLTSLEITPDVLPLVDDWAVCPDGSVAVVRGHDYHVDWLSPDGRWTSTPKMAFDWQHLNDGQKTTLIDSAWAALKARRDSMDAAHASAGPSSAASGGGRAGGGGASGPAPAFLDGRSEPGDIPDYRPPFVRGSVRADADGNLWIRTTNVVNGQPVYDVVNRRGEVTDRIQLPPFRTIAGFGVGVVFMAVKDSAGVVHLERARVK
jgi:hypothetical protein